MAHWVARRVLRGTEHGGNEHLGQWVYLSADDYRDAYWQKLSRLRAEFLPRVVEELTSEPALAPDGAIHTLRARLDHVRRVLEQEEAAGEAPLSSIIALDDAADLLVKLLGAMDVARGRNRALPRDEFMRLLALDIDAVFPSIFGAEDAQVRDDDEGEEDDDDDDDDDEDEWEDAGGGAAGAAWLAANAAPPAPLAQAAPAIAVPGQMQVIALPTPAAHVQEVMRLHYDFQRDLIRQGFTYARTAPGGTMLYERPMPAPGEPEGGADA